MTNMNKYKLTFLQLIVIGFVGLSISGCSALREGFASQMEVPTLEKQANRVAVGMTIVRENNIMAFKKPISADALWPKAINAELTEKQRKHIANTLQSEPYFATVHFTESIQRKMLGSSVALNRLGDYANVFGSVFSRPISPLTYRAIQKIEAFYGTNPKMWPNIFNYSSSLDNFLDFKDGTLLDVEALNGDVYETLGEAMIALTPISMQKSLNVARSEMLEGYENVADLKSQKGQLETTLKKDSKKLSSQEKNEATNDLAVVDERVKEAESIANEKELIYFTLLDDAVVALESDMNIDDENYVNLARNVNIVAAEIQRGSTEAYAAFGLALTNIIANNILLKFPQELESLAYGTAFVPSNLQSKYAKRIARLAKNAVYLLPNIFIGTYYANKQSNLAEKYQAVTELIMLAYGVKVDQDKAYKKDN